jgi:ribonuclease G
LSKELVIQSSEKGADIALLEDRRLVELHHDRVAEDFLVGDIYLGRIRKILPNLNAAFVDIGHDKDAFLHYHDLGPNIRSLNRFVDLVKKGNLREPKVQSFRLEPEIVKTGKIEDVFVPNQNVMVQIVKEPISTKGPRLTSQVSLSGRYVILIPFSDGLSISKKIRTKQERDRLRKTIGAMKVKNFGIIIRTNAEGATEEALAADLKKLHSDWETAVKSLIDNKPKLYSELDRTTSMLRDMVNKSISRITVDDAALFKQLKGYMQSMGGNQGDLVRLYKGDRRLFEAADVEKQIKSLFNKIVNLSGGAYLIIEHTEAMHVIDVNSGSKRGKDDDQEENALRTNMEAAEEIARQLRLRDMGGIVVIDFIDMRRTANRKQLYDKFRDVMKDDRAKHTILPLSKFGLMQITRQRVRQEIVRDESEPCPMCGGTGEINKGAPVTEDIIFKIESALRADGKKINGIKVHPLVHAYLTKGLISQQMKWFLKYRRWLNLVGDEHFTLNQYEIN